MSTLVYARFKSPSTEYHKVRGVELLLGRYFSASPNLPLPHAACARPPSFPLSSIQTTHTYTPKESPLHKLTHMLPRSARLPRPRSPPLHHIAQANADIVGEAIVRQSPIVMNSSDTRPDCFEHRKKTYMTKPALKLDEGLTTFAAGLTVSVGVCSSMKELSLSLSGLFYT